MHNPRFVVLTGHLNDYPLSDIVGILRHQGKTGRLLVEYPKGPASFFFQEGELVDAQLNDLSGLQAICVAVAQPASPFNFNPLIPCPRRSIESSFQRVVSELLGCWDESAVQIDTVATERTLPKLERLAIPASSNPLEPTDLAVLALPAPAQQPISRTILMMAAAGLMMIGISTVIAVTRGFKNRAEIARSSSSSFENKAVPAPQNTGGQLSNSTQTQLRKTARAQTGAAKTREVTSMVEQASHRESTSSSKRDETNAPDQSGRIAPEESKPNSGVADSKSRASFDAQSVNVVMQIENGRVLKASIAGHKAGMDNYEALALRIARQRRYPSKATGQETVRITVTQPN